MNDYERRCIEAAEEAVGAPPGSVLQRVKCGTFNTSDKETNAARKARQIAAALLWHGPEHTGALALQRLLGFTDYRYVTGAVTAGWEHPGFAELLRKIEEAHG